MSARPAVGKEVVEKEHGHGRYDYFHDHDIDSYKAFFSGV